MERIFIIIGRINSVLLLLILLGAGISIALMSWSSSQWQRRGAIEVPAGESASEAQVLLRFERIENITGANTQMMLLSAQAKSEKFSSGSGYGSETRNVLFLIGNEKTARWLFPKQNNLILVTAQLREKSKNPKDNPTKALYFEYVQGDTNGDGKLSAQDHSSVALSKPDGLGFVEVLHGVSRVLSYEMIDSQYLSVVYQTGKTVRHARLSVLSLAKETDQEVVNVPDEL